MASLNGKQINDSYRGLIKLIDNLEVTSSDKELTDGYGNPIGIHVNSIGGLTAEGNVEVQGILDSSGGNKIAFFFADQSSFPDATTYHGALAHSHADGAMYFSHSGSWVKLALDSDITTTDLTTITGAVTIDSSDVSTITDDAVITSKILDVNVTTAKIANDAITHDKLEDRYTSINAIGTTSGAFDIDFSLGAIQTATLGGAHTGTFTNFKVGQVIDIIIEGNHALTLSATASGTPAINKVGTTDYDGTTTQIIQVQCASDDSATPIFYYACNTYVADTAP